MTDDVLYEVDAGIATITMNRPDVHNAFTRDTIFQLNGAIRDARDDDAVYAIILTGAGDGFCSGADVRSMPDWTQMTKEDYAGYLWSVQNVIRQLRTTTKPSAAAVDGPAVGAGCDFALAADVRYLSPNALLREGFVRIGLIPGDGGGWLLPRLIGEAKAREYLLTGKDITPSDAVELGLAVEVTDDPLGAARGFTEEVRDLPATAVQHTKALIDSEQSYEDYSERAIEYQWACVNDAEHHEAVAAFNEKRVPDFDREY
ncbi:enoyl-CoA hydratase/isomerase family protein [Halomarina halobia]|uniref:Enoyl-CoA hydratase/isomerase family protein n=1 Tax=Halomarina halobia TaxID=3033386 RepID=A0ABD6AFB1_9EURY|nr:enoyl-CoA hydratase-related protein [Halomarina sp. PSR21]